MVPRTHNTPTTGWATGTALCVACLFALLAPLAIAARFAPAPIPWSRPAAVVAAPQLGSLPGATDLHVQLAFKLNAGGLARAQGRESRPGPGGQPGSLAARIGLESGDYRQIISYFQAAGITVKTSPLRTFLALTGSARSFERALRTGFVLQTWHGHAFYAPTRSPELPAFIADRVQAITGLSNYPLVTQPTSFLTRSQPSNVQAAPTASCAPPGAALLPSMVAHAYGYDQFWGQGDQGQHMTVDLIEIDGFDPADVQQYFSCVGFGGALQVVNVDGVPQQALGESTLDIEMIAGLARSATIVDYETNATTTNDIWVNINDILQRIIADNASPASSRGSVVSISLGAAEESVPPADLAAIDQSLQTLSQAEHVPVFVASGDRGAFATQGAPGLAVSFPASDPHAVAVGGTILFVDATGNRVAESAWPWSGGGNSQVFPRPAWQQAPGIPSAASNGNRQVPDVAAAATDLPFFFQGQWADVGGTSAAAPIWAAGATLLNEAASGNGQSGIWSPDQLYVRAAAGQHTFDITQGGNGVFQAAQGWDFLTGLGSPNSNGSPGRAS